MSIRSSFSGGVRKMIHNMGRELVHPNTTYLFNWHRPQLFKMLGINLVFDAGANVGQTGLGLREDGYTGKIVSLEPLSGPFSQLAKVAAADGNWQSKRCAVGGSRGEAKINVSRETVYSSLLPMDNKLTGWIDPNSEYVGTETVEVHGVDDLMAEFAKPGDKVCLKLDVQGFEMEVLRGAREKSLPKLQLIQLELTFPHMYEGQPKYYDVLKFLDEAGFEMVGVTPISRDHRTHRYYQADALFAQRIEASVPELAGTGAAKG